jgi:hypothetical protein
MWQMWFYTLPDELDEGGGALPVLGGKPKPKDV